LCFTDSGYYDHSFPAPTRDETERGAIEVVYTVVEGGRYTTEHVEVGGAR